MSQNNAKTLTEKIVELLEEERAALIDFDLARLSDIAGAKAALVHELKTSTNNDAAQFESVKRIALRNQDLLDHALDGIRSVADRVAEIRRVRQRLETYDQSGSKKTFVTNASSIEKRA